ncbi:uncharacterized protein ACVWZA_003372 [Sphingomonas sp. UYAg733]
MFNSYIIKLTGYCNLDCSYCYMFNSADRTYSRKPSAMTIETAIATLDMIAADGARTGRTRFEVTLHGGEPTLWPVANFERLFEHIRALRTNGLEIDLGLQSNLFKLPSPRLIELFEAMEMKIGVSLDGPRAANDSARVDFAGRGSYDRVMGNVRALIDRGHGDLIGGFLCVMQPDIPPNDFLDWIAGLPVTRVNLLWPLELNHGNLPWQDQAAYAADPRYGTWLAELFDAWLRLDRADVHIDRFQGTMRAILGGLVSSDDHAAWSLRSLVINTDGAIELSDYFRPSSDGAAETGFSVHQHGPEAVAAWPTFVAHKAAAERQPDQCRTCEHWQHCGGGTLAGRFDATGRITDQPSVLCHDHRHFFDRVSARLSAAQAA